METSPDKTQDHDLLIRLDQKVENVMDEIKSIKNETLQSVVDLKKDKLDRSEFKTVEENIRREIIRVEADRRTADKDMETRMRAQERFTYIALGVSIVLELVVLPLILKFVFNL